MPLGSRETIAVVGAGVAGLGAAWRLSEKYDVTVYEARATPGGHAYGAVLRDTGEFVDMGVIITLPWAYPNLHATFDRYGVQTRASAADLLVSFGSTPASEVVWGTDANLRALPFFHGHLAREASRFEQMMFEVSSLPFELQLLPISTFVTDHVPGVPHSGEYDREFLAKGLAPLLSLFLVTRQSLLDTPAWSLSLMFRNAALSFFSPTVWRTIVGGTRNYVSHLVRQFDARFLLSTTVDSVARDARGVTVVDRTGRERRYDHVVFGTSAEITLKILTDGTDEERAILARFPYEDAHVYLHGDKNVLSPRFDQDRFFFQYRSPNASGTTELDGVFTYNMKLGYRLRAAAPVLVSVYHKEQHPEPAGTVDHQFFRHTIPNADAMRARLDLHTIQGHRRAWFCGDYVTFNSHEDAFTSGMIIAEALGVGYPYRSHPAAFLRYRQNRLLMLPRLGGASRLDPQARLELLGDTLGTVLPAARDWILKRVQPSAT